MRAHGPRIRRGKDAEQIQFHYDVSDDFYALWLDPRRVYSCAYYRDPSMTLAQAQEAKLEHICRKLMLRPASASWTSAPGGAGCCCGRRNTMAWTPPASRCHATSMPMCSG